MKNNDIFIITTIYNASNVLGITLNSLLEQKERNIIHYIYDDCSTDNCDDIIFNYIKNVNISKKPYKVIYEKGSTNFGVDKAHEYAFKKTIGAYVMWLDAGDYLDKYAIKTINKNISKYNNYHVFHLNSRHYKTGTVFRFERPTSSYYNARLLNRKNQTPCWVFGDFFYHNFVISVEALHNIFNKECYIYDKHEHGGLFYDAQIILRILAKGYFIKFIKKPLSYILRDDKSIAVSFQWDAIKKEECIKKILEGNKDFAPFKAFYYDYSKLVKSVKMIHYYCKYEKNTEKAKNAYKSLLSFLKNNNKRINYFFLHRIKYRAIICLYEIISKN